MAKKPQGVGSHFKSLRHRRNSSSRSNSTGITAAPRHAWGAGHAIKILTQHASIIFWEEVALFGRNISVQLSKTIQTKNKSK